MSFPAYPKYKTTRAEWLGKIPNHWPLTPLKHLVRFTGGGTPDKQNLDYWDGNILWVSPKDMRVEVIRNTQDKITEAAIESSATHWVSKGAVLIVFRSGILCRTIPVALAGTGLCLNQDMKALVGFPDPTYLLRLIQAHTAELLPIWRQQGATVESLDYEQVINTEIPFPPIEERRKIIELLDHETAKIDALVAEQKRLIELLQEKRQAIISHAVTKGLDPNVPMKDSGVEWLGEIPDHWSLSKLKHLITVTGGSTPSKSRLDYWDGDIPWASPRDIKTDYLADTFHHISEKALAECGNEIVRENTILVVVRGMILAHSFPISVTSTPMTINQDLKALTTLPGTNQAYLTCLLNGIKREVFRYVDSSAHGTRKLEWERFTSVDLPRPPVSEQRAIATSIETQIHNFDVLEGECSTLIARLTERRSALISAAVTGKIDVRNWRPAEEADNKAEPLPMAAEERAHYQAQ